MNNASHLPPSVPPDPLHDRGTDRLLADVLAHRALDRAMSEPKPIRINEAGRPESRQDQRHDSYRSLVAACRIMLEQAHIPGPPGRVDYCVLVEDEDLERVREIVKEIGDATCPYCFEDQPERLIRQEDGRTVHCDTCGQDYTIGGGA